MTNDQIRIAIAELVGRNGWWCPQCKKLVDEHSLGYQCRHANCTESAQQAPNYPSDLNAMHEAEKEFHKDHLQAELYAYELDRVVYRTKHSGTGIAFQSINSTALQRAEAFLRVKGKWIDTLKSV